MAGYNYETHKIPNPLLPFIYHRRFEVRSRDKVPNWHENIEILQATEGEGYVRCGAEELPFRAGDLLVINADILHGIGSEERLVYRCLIVDNSFFEQNGIPIRSLHFQSVIRDEALYGLFDAIVRGYAGLNAEDFRTVLAVRTGVLQLLQALCADYITAKPSLPSNEYIKQAVVYIRQNLSRRLTLDDLADHLGISKFHLARQFKTYTGKTVVQTVNLMRCAEAQRLIENGSTVSAAAVSCGFENLSYFTRTYKALMGHLPSDRLP